MSGDGIMFDTEFTILLEGPHENMKGFHRPIEVVCVYTRTPQGPQLRILHQMIDGKEMDDVEQMPNVWDIQSAISRYDWAIRNRESIENLHTCQEVGLP